MRRRGRRARTRVVDAPMRSYSLERGPGRARTWCSSSLRVRVLRPLRPSSCCPSCSCLSSCGAAPGRASSSCGSRRRASRPSDSAGPRAGSGSTSSKPWGRGTLPAGEGPRRETQGEVLITVDGAPLDCGHSLAVRNHSPTGPAGGYGGSGPTQLALAILLVVTDEATAERFYQPFPWSVIAPIEADRWALDAGDVLGGLEVGGRLGRTTSSTWRWTRVVRAGCLGTQRICPAAVRPPCLCGRIRAQYILSIRILGFAIPPCLCGDEPVPERCTAMDSATTPRARG